MIDAVKTVKNSTANAIKNTHPIIKPAISILNFDEAIMS